LVQSIVDRIPDSMDASPASHHWDLVLSPLLGALTHKAETDPAHLYVASGAKAQMSPDYGIDASEIDELPVLASSILSSKFLYQLDRPVVLIGNAGVGKTSWISHFLDTIKSQARVHTLYYSQKQEAGRPMSSPMKPIEKFQAIFFHILAAKLQEVLRHLGETTLAIFQYDVARLTADELRFDYPFTSAIQAAIRRIYTRGGQLIVIIDDLDMFDETLQAKAFETAAWLARTQGVNIIVPMRPLTYRARSTNIAFRPSIFAVPPPPLRALLMNRKNYEFNVRASPAMAALKEIFATNALTLDLVATGVIGRDLKGLERFYEKLIRSLSENEYLERALYSMHNQNIDQISHVLSKMISSKFIEDEFRDKVTGKTQPLRRREKVVTAYLRGPYGHYRGPSDAYPVADISIFNVPQVPLSRIMLPVRVLHYLINRMEEVTGSPSKDVAREIAQFGYPTPEVVACIGYLIKRGLIFSSTTDALIEHVQISPAGKYLASELMTEFSFRFCEASADVFRKPLPQDRELKRDKGFYSMADNAVTIFDFLLRSYELEARSVLGSGNKELIATYLRELASDNAEDGDWIRKMLDDIKGRVSSISHGRIGLAEKNSLRHLHDKTLPALESRLRVLREEFRQAASVSD